MGSMPWLPPWPPRPTSSWRRSIPRPTRRRCACFPRGARTWSPSVPERSRQPARASARPPPRRGSRDALSPPSRGHLARHTAPGHLGPPQTAIGFGGAALRIRKLDSMRCEIGRSCRISMPKNPHRSGATMIVDRYDPVNLFELVPKLNLQFEPELAHLDRLLDDDELFNLVKADLLKRHPNSGRCGGHSTPVEVILRMLIVKRLYNFSYEQTQRFVNESIVLRQFCRLYLEKVPDDTTLIRWANVIGPETVASLNDRAVQLARSLKVTRGRKLRIDGTVVETNIHHPTDDTLISDGVRVVGRLLMRAKSFMQESVLSKQKGEPFRNRTRSAKRLAHKISKMVLRRSQEAKVDLRAAYERLLEVGKATLKQAGRVRDLLGESPSARKVADEISRFSELLEWAVGQARRRVLEGERLEAEEKLLSLFEEHTVVIRRGKAHKQTEFGRKVWLSEVEGGIVSGFSILEGNAGDEAQLKR